MSLVTIFVFLASIIQTRSSTVPLGIVEDADVYSPISWDYHSGVTIEDSGVELNNIGSENTEHADLASQTFNYIDTFYSSEAPMNTGSEEIDNDIDKTSTTTSKMPYDVGGNKPKNDEPPEWSVIFDRVQLVCTLVGFLANASAFVTLLRNYQGFSRLILVLLRHQSFVDALVCAMATAIMLQPSNWVTGNHYLDTLICHVWHGQAFYWGGVTLSTYNLVLISVERYLAVCKPLKYGFMVSMSRMKIYLYLLTLYPLCILITHGTYIQTKMVNGACVNGFIVENQAVEIYFTAFVVFTYITTYFIPAAMMAILYGIISRKLQLRKADGVLGHSNIIDRAGAQLTKTAVVVTVIFIISIGYDLHYYLLGHTGVVKYELNKPTQKVGVFLSNLNSCLNPFVYAALMPLFRRSLKKTFCCSSISTESRERSVIHSLETTKDFARSDSSLQTPDNQRKYELNHIRSN